MVPVGEVEALRVDISNKEKDLRMEITHRLRCEYLLDNPDAPKQEPIPKDWLLTELRKMGTTWDPDEYARGMGIGIK